MRAIDLDALPSVDEARLECKRRQAIIIQHATVREVAVEVTQPSVIPGAVRRSAAADSDLPGVKILDCKVEKPALDPIARSRNLPLTSGCPVHGELGCRNGYPRAKAPCREQQSCACVQCRTSGSQSPGISKRDAGPG